MSLIPDSHKDLLEKPVYATLTTVMPDGQPQSTIVWVDTEGEYIRFNSARGRQKVKNLETNPRVTVMLLDPENPFRWLEIRGTVTETTEQGGAEHIEKLSWKYVGQQYYGGFNTWKKPEDETRVVYKIQVSKTNIAG